MRRLAALAITGALRTMLATNVSDLRAGTLPIDLLMRKVCYRAAVRLASLPSYYDLVRVCSTPCSKLPEACR